MKNVKKRTAAVALTWGFFFLSLAGCAGSLNDKKAAVQVGQETISWGVLNFYARLTQARYETYYAPFMRIAAEQMWAQMADEKSSYEQKVKEEILQSLENMVLIRQHAKDYGVELTDDEKKAIEDAAANFIQANEKDRIDVVSGAKENIQEVLTLMTFSHKMQDPMTSGVDLEVSDEEAAQKSMQYVLLSFQKTDEEGATIDVSEEEKAAMRDAVQDMLDLVGKGEAKDLKEAAEQIKGGEALSFDLDVKTTSFDSSSTYPGKEIVKAADALEKENDVTSLLEDDAKVGAAQLISLLDRKATDTKKESIISDRKNEAYNHLLEQWKEATKIDEEKNVWEKIDFKKQGVTIKQPPKEEPSPQDSTETEEK